MTKDKRITIRIDEATEEQIHIIKEKVKDDFGIQMNNSELIRYVVNQLAKGIVK